MERYKWYVLGISEMRWTGTGKTVLHSGNKLWWSDDEAKHAGGVGFLTGTNLIESKDETLLSTAEEVTSRWKEYC